MKYFILPLTLFLISGCVSVYKGTDSKKVAYISVPKTTTNYKLVGGFSGKNVTIGDIGDNGCMTNVAKINEESLNENNKLVAPADREIGLSISAYQGNSTCSLGFAVSLEEGANYTLDFGQGYSLCRLKIAKVLGDDNLQAVNGAQLKPGFSKMCK